MLTEAGKVIQLVTEILDRLSITYMIGGSVASGIHGVYRYTNDIDIVADIQREHAAPLVAALHEFYADDEAIRGAIETTSSFSILHLEIMTKVDIFIKPNDAWTNEVWRRRRYLAVTGGVQAYLPSPEDAILQKIRWFQMGGGVSDRQWGDILGILKIQGDKIDRAYLRSWAVRLNLAELLAKAIDMAKMS